jgi:hypothetical protein
MMMLVVVWVMVVMVVAGVLQCCTLPMHVPI